MPTYLEIAVNVPQVTGVFHYHLPAEMETKVSPGHLVEVPFGKQVVQGVVLDTVSQPAVPDTKAVVRLLDPQCVLTKNQILLAREMAKATLAPLAACTGLMLPPGLGQQADTLYTSSRQPSADSHPRDTTKNQYLDRQQTAEARQFTRLEKRILEMLEERGPLRGRQIEHTLSHINWKPALQRLERWGYVSAEPVLPSPTVRPKQVRTVQLACPPAEAKARMAELGRHASPALARRQAALRFLMEQTAAVDAAWVYAESGAKLDDLHKLADMGLVKFGESETWRDPLAQTFFTPSQPPVLTTDQARALADINQGIQTALAGGKTVPYLLHGVTGSGKTEIYLRAVAETLQADRQAICLVPEIALTPQTIQRFLSRFPGQVGLIHSRLSEGERYDTWRRARAAEIKVVVGPRSALFSPFPSLGLIVVDEFHDDSYYQSETPPYYHARNVAILYAALSGAVCVLGSATPDIASRYQAEAGHWHYIRLPNRILAHRQAIQAQVDRLGLSSQFRTDGATAETADLPPVRIVDMRQELKAGNRSIFSRSLQTALKDILNQKQQAILFLNRRGAATFVFCRDCGYALKCPRCDIPLTYHLSRATTPIQASISHADHAASANPDLQCHYCDYRRKLPKTCPQCNSQRIRHYGTGTESVESEIQALFPQARVLRWDYETTRHKGAHDLILSNFANHHADILVGTQMIAKGLDLPLVTLVGMVLADVGLSLPDYRATERTFHLLTQVAGRAGRSLLGGQVILQTFQPDHYVIQAASHHDYQSFYDQELSYRKQMGYPPYSHFVRLEYRQADSAKAEEQAQKLATRLKAKIEALDRQQTELIGPSPCFFSRLGGTYRWQLILRGPAPASLLRDLPLGDWRIEVDPVSLL